MAAQEVAHSVPCKFPDPLRLRRGGLLNIEIARVYFLGGGGLIKIGVTTDVDVRWRSIQLSSPVAIQYLGSFPGIVDDERELHAKFKHLRKHGEWFLDTEELRAEIVRLCGDLWFEGYPPPMSNDALAGRNAA